MRRRRSSPKRRRGVTCVEFALVAPILFLIVFATIELWRVNVIVHMADQAAYEAAREMMVPGATADDGIELADAVMAAAGVRSVTVTVDPETINDQTPEVTVTVSINMSENTWVMPQVYLHPTVASTITLKRETIVD